MKKLQSAYLVLGSIKDVTHGVVENVLSRIHTLENVLDMPFDRLVDAGFPLKAASSICDADLDFAGNELKLLDGIGGKLIVYEDSAYPDLLKQIHSPPLYLYCLGDESCLNDLCISIVGARKVSRNGQEMSSKLAYDLCRAGITVVSGLAYGVDIYAHTAALKADGSTVAVLGSGLLNIYPDAHKKYVSNICKKGCIITEFPMNEPPNGYNFPKRNRIVSGLSYGTVIVEASNRSGSLITSRFALEQGRDVFAVPVSPLCSNNATNNLIRNGSILVESADDILSEYYYQLKDIINDKDCCGGVCNDNTDDIDPMYQIILDILGIDGQTPDELTDKLKIGYEQVVSCISMMEIEGYVVKGSDSRYYPG